MPLHLYTLSKDRPSDFKFLQAVARIHVAAWLTLPLMQTIWYGPKSGLPANVKKHVEQHAHSLKNEDACRIVLVLDDELDAEVFDAQEEEAKGVDQSADGPHGRVIAAIKYYAVPGQGPHPDSGTQEVIDNPDQPVHESSYENEALSSVFVKQLVAARQHAMQTLGNHLIVDQLYTDPAHHRRGAGGMLMRHACQEADRLGLPSMLEASPKGMKVYEAAGFRTVDWPGADIWLDLKRWENGGDKGQEFEDQRLRSDASRRDGWYAQIVMVRPVNSGAKSEIELAEAGTNGAVIV